MGNHKLTMELIADKKSHYTTFKRREMGLKKKISELWTVFDVKACLIVYGSDGDVVLLSLGFGRKIGTKLNVKKKNCKCLLFK